MINSIELTNFQSHQESKLDFHPGINTIIGSSDSGKSSILRGLLWAVYNRPSGEAFVSHWARNEKGKQIEKTIVTITKNNKELMRARDYGFNGYDIDGKILEAIKTDVPEQVQDFFNLSEVNIQKQHDKAFLLQETAGEVARFFNRIIKLDEIDKALSLIDSKKRECDKKLKTLKADQIEQTETLKTYDWIEGVEPIISKAEKIEERIKGKMEDTNNLGISIKEHEKLSLTVEKTGRIWALEVKVKEVENINDELEEKKLLLDKLSQSLHNHYMLQEIENRGEKLINKEEMIEKVIELTEKVKKLLENVSNYQNSVGDYLKISTKIPIIIENMEKLKEKMPDVCPLCDGTGRLK